MLSSVSVNSMSVNPHLKMYFSCYFNGLKHSSTCNICVFSRQINQSITNSVSFWTETVTNVDAFHINICQPDIVIENEFSMFACVRACMCVRMQIAPFPFLLQNKCTAFFTRPLLNHCGNVVTQKLPKKFFLQLYSNILNIFNQGLWFLQF